VDRGQILKELDAADREIDRIVRAALEKKEDVLWRDLRRASLAFSAEAHRLISMPNAETFSSQDLFRRHEEVISVVAKLIEASHVKAGVAESQIGEQAHSLVIQSSTLLGAAMLLALLFAVLTMRMTADMFRRMEWQTGELSRVSWHMLQNQESAARRFSHELHDELGQALTAVKANLLAMKAPTEPKRHADCLALVDESIQNVREISQLLRPTILDDFGLDASLRSLAEKFHERTGVAVDYESNFSGRLQDETETHLYRIAQEALTNVARHAQATQVRLTLRAQDDKLRLAISDNGRGLPVDGKLPSGGLGMVGMRARARSAGGEFMVYPQAGRGLAVDVWVPATARTE
jgi:signal transduction histidine kinase